MRIHTIPILLTTSTLALWLSGCTGIPIAGESAAREDVGLVRELRSEHPSLTSLRGTDSLDAYLRYALWNHPAAEAAYERWSASVDDVTVRRSLPDPRLTLQLDYTRSLMSLMPGLSLDYPRRTRRVAEGKAALATSGVAYREYVATLDVIAAGVRSAWIALAYAEESAQLGRDVTKAMDDAAAATESDYVTARNGDLARIVALRNEAAGQRVAQASLDDRCVAARAAFKASLGLGRADPDPAWPTASLARSELPDENTLWSAVERSNPELARLRSMVEAAVADTAVAEQSRHPDFAFGGMVDVQANPLMYRPQGGMTLPIWKDKIRAEIDAAEARKSAAAAAVRAKEVALAAQLADDLYRIREADRTLDYLENGAMPALRAVEKVSLSQYQSGNGTASAPSLARAQLARLAQTRLDVLKSRENAVTDLLLISAGIVSADAPLKTK